MTLQAAAHDAGQADASALDFDPARLEEHLRGLLGPPDGPLQIRRTEGGMSNPTYFLQRGAWQAVLRKQPSGVVLPSAHAIDREFRVYTALYGSELPVPKPLHYCFDRDVLGTPFYLMERLDGRVFDAYATPGLRREERAELFDAMLRAMAALHRLDFKALGLANYGRPGNYFARQLKRWSEQWAGFRRGEDDNPALDRIGEWLQERVPESEQQALCHGDFRIGNLMFHASEPRVIGVLDWELSTLGHPLADVAFNCQAWHMAPNENGGLRGLSLAQLGIPGEDEYLERYYALAGSSERLSAFHKVFAMFRAAVGTAGVALRGASGQGFLPQQSRVGRRLSLAYATLGLEMIE